MGATIWLSRPPSPQRVKAPQNVTLNTIAEHANCTCALVSLALRNSPKVAKATRERIRKIADELGYKPNPMVRALMTHIRQGRKVHYQSTLAFLTNLRSADYWKTLPTYPEYFRGASERAAAAGYKVEHFWLGKFRENPARFVKMLEARGVPGVLVPPLPHGSDSLNVDLSGLSVVTLGYSLASASMPRICNHHLQTLERTVQHLYMLGYRKIGIALAQNDIRQVNYLWIAGIEVARHKYPGARIHVFEPVTWTEKEFHQWYQYHHFEVIVGVSMEIWQWSQNLGLSIPREIGFFHLDCRLNDSVSGMYQRTAYLGEAATEMLISLVENNIQLRDEEPRILLLNSELNEGTTVSLR